LLFGRFPDSRSFGNAAPGPAKPKVPDYLKSAIKNKAGDFVESFLKPVPVYL